MNSLHIFCPDINEIKFYDDYDDDDDDYDILFDKYIHRYFFDEDAKNKFLDFWQIQKFHNVSIFCLLYDFEHQSRKKLYNIFYTNYLNMKKNLKIKLKIYKSKKKEI